MGGRSRGPPEPDFFSSVLPFDGKLNGKGDQKDVRWVFRDHRGIVILPFLVPDDFRALDRGIEERNGLDLVGDHLADNLVFSFFVPGESGIRMVFGNQLFLFQLEPDEKERTLVSLIDPAEGGEENGIVLALENDAFHAVGVLPCEWDDVADAGVHDPVDGLVDFEAAADAFGAFPGVVEGGGCRGDDQRDENHHGHGCDHFHECEGALIHLRTPYLLLPHTISCRL